ncbi:MAG TPA: response regulator transcription factor [Gaiellaceae bacterium]|nr:response regulator transcription factor [Gaiellaceae bacterium]
MSRLARDDLMGAGQAPITCVIADDHPAVLDSVSRVLADRGIGVVAQARDGEDAVRAIEEHKPLVAVVDLRMPGLSGIGVARRIGQHTALILYTGYGDRALLIEALDAGVRGFVLKEAPLADIARAVETVAKGDVYVDPVLAGVLASGEAAQQLKMLTPREREVLRLLADGLGNEEIGRELHIAGETARAHIRNAMRKLAADTRTHAVAMALRRSLIE